MPTELALKRHQEWKTFISQVQVVVEPVSEGFVYYIGHPTLGQDRAPRGAFASREDATASGNAVIALKWPEPKLEP